MEQIEQYDTLTEAINSLRLQGYVEDFNLKNNILDCRMGEFQIHPDEFEIDKLFRFYGPSDPDDESILYAISSDKYGLRGLLVNGFGISSDAMTQDMIDKLG